MIRVPFFLLFGFNKGTQEKKGTRALLRNLIDGQGRPFFSFQSVFQRCDEFAWAPSCAGERYCPPNNQSPKHQNPLRGPE